MSNPKEFDPETLIGLKAKREEELDLGELDLFSSPQFRRSFHITTILRVLVEKVNQLEV